MIKKVKPSLKHRLRPLLFVFRLLAVFLLIIGFARPQEGIEKTKISTEGIAIQIVLDKSGSMEEIKMKSESGELKSRLKISKEVIRDFVMGGKADLQGRPNDQVGLITFASYVEENCPLTLDHYNLVDFLNSVKTPVFAGNTAIGDAIYHATLSLISEDMEEKNTDYKIKSKIIILLTDGEQNAGKWLPVEAAKFAKNNGIKVYTIAMINKDSFVIREDPIFGRRKIPIRQQFDTSELQKVAELTKGQFKKAWDETSLRDIYQYINKHEKTKFEKTFIQYRELYMLFVIPGFVLLLLEIILSTTWLRKIP